LSSRIEDPLTHRTIVVQQRLHEEDIVGHLLEQGGWAHLNLPAIAEKDEVIPLSFGNTWQRTKGDLLIPERFTREWLDREYIRVGPRIYGAQQQQNPIYAEGGAISLEWFGQYNEMPDRGFFHRIVQSWDPAVTDGINSAFSVGMTWGFREGVWYLLDLLRVKLRYPDLKERVVTWHGQWRCDALVLEYAGVGIGLYDDIRKLNLPGLLRAPTPRGSKLDRMVNRTAQLREGQYLLPKDAPWLSELRHEFVGFPDGRFTDQVDAFSQFLDFVSGNGAWVEREYTADGRPLKVQRRVKRDRYYGGRASSAG
jgi:predicted phage terminase large subunit-like protein